MLVSHSKGTLYPGGLEQDPELRQEESPQDADLPFGYGNLPEEDAPWFWGMVLALILLTTLPLGVAAARQGGGWRFTGFLLNVEDGNSYIAKMLLGRAGAWRFRSPYTLMPQAGYWLFGPYLLLGKLARLPVDVHTQLVVLFHLFRLGALVILAWSTYRLAALFLPQGHWRRWAVILMLAGSGWDWLLLPWGRAAWGNVSGPPSLISPEAFGFLALLSLPHIVLARALLLDLLVQWVHSKPGRSSAQRLAWVTGLMVWTNPLEAVPWLLLIGLGSGLYWVFQKRRNLQTGWRDLWRWLRPVTPSLAIALAALCYLVILQFDPYVRLWTAQNRLPSPPLWVYALSYGWLLPLWIAARKPLAAQWRQGRPWAMLPTLWGVSTVVLALIPVPIQRRLVEGAWVGWVLPAMLGAATWARSPCRRLCLTLSLVPAFVAPALLLVASMRTAWSPALPAFRPIAEVRAFEALAAEAQPGDGVLTACVTGNALPAWAPVRVPLGHGPESAPREANQALVRDFYAGKGTSESRYAHLVASGVRWVFFGPAERTLGSHHPGSEPWLALHYAADDYAIYRVLSELPDEPTAR